MRRLGLLLVGLTVILSACGSAATTTGSHTVGRIRPLNHVVSVALAWGSTLAVTGDGRLWAWGDAVPAPLVHCLSNTLTCDDRWDRVRAWLR